MEGRAIARPNVRLVATDSNEASVLQWRAGQLPGQTCGGHSTGVEQRRPSMEGRAIARPNQAPLGRDDRPVALQWRAGQLPGQTRPGRPDRPRRRAPSMEGRAIARPNPAVTPSSCISKSPFNGGPGNCPAKPEALEPVDDVVFPSMEGRAIARPNLSQSRSSADTARLQWRAGQLPGQTRDPRPRHGHIHRLQWRAGQLPGQTRKQCRDCGVPSYLQWRAGQLPGQTIYNRPKNRRGRYPSMEGRAIARPN